MKLVKLAKPASCKGYRTSGNIPICEIGLLPPGIEILRINELNAKESIVYRSNFAGARMSHNNIMCRCPPGNSFEDSEMNVFAYGDDF